MKLVLIITDYGSFNNFLSEVAVQMVKDGHEVSVICSPLKVIDYEDKYPYTSMGIKFHYLQFPRSFNLAKQIVASKRINKKILDIGPDLVNIHFTTGIFTTVIWRKPPFFTIGTMHGIGYPVIKNAMKRFVFKMIEQFCFKRLDQIFLLNDFDYQLVEKLYPTKAFKYNSFGVGCDLDKFNALRFLDNTKAKIRNELSIENNDFVLAFTGRFVFFKGFDALIRAMISIINELKYTDIKLLLIGGEDPAHSTGLTDSEKAFFDSHNQFVNIGYTANVDKYLSITDLFIFPSEKEGMPVCIMEALAMGVPVITSNTRGCNDLIESYFNGILLNEKPSSNEIKESILKLYNDRELLKTFSQNALGVRDKLSRNKYVESQIDVYRSNISAVNNE